MKVIVLFLAASAFSQSNLSGLAQYSASDFWCSKNFAEFVDLPEKHKKARQIILIDFENIKIQCIQQEAISAEFLELEAKFSANEILILTEIKRNKIWAKISLETTEMVQLPTKQCSFIKDKSLAYITTGLPVKVFGNKSLKIGNSFYGVDVFVSDDYRVANLGIDFLKCFDWIFDFRRNKVYFRKNAVAMSAGIIPLYKVAIRQGNLEIVRTSTTVKQYAVANRIKSVQDEPITEENICNTATLLNSGVNWNQLNVKVKQ